MFRVLYLSFWVVFTIIGTVSADSPVDIPDVHIGDIWKYRQIDGFTNEANFEFSHRIVDLSDHEITIQLKNTVKSGNSLYYYTREWNPLDLGSARFTPYRPEYRFPMSIGEVWKQEFKVSTTVGKFYSSFMSAKVVTLEKITVPAGTFDAYRVEEDADALSNDENAIATKRHTITWYAPVVKNFVRREITLFSSGRMRSKNVSELVEYSLQEKPHQLKPVAPPSPPENGTSDF